MRQPESTHKKCITLTTVTTPIYPDSTRIEILKHTFFIDSMPVCSYLIGVVCIIITHIFHFVYNLLKHIEKKESISI